MCCAIYILDHDIVYNIFPNGWVRFAFDVTQPYFDSDGDIYKEINTVIRGEMLYIYHMRSTSQESNELNL